MQKKKKPPLVEKSKLHLRSKHKGQYDFAQLIIACSELAQYVRMNDYQNESIDFSNPEAVKMLNKALLKQYYNIAYWDIPQNYLCPPIPGRVDYIHHIADVLGSVNHGKIPTGDQIKCLDIGLGANCIYPILGNTEYGWSFVGADIDPVAIESANKIIKLNPSLKGKVECRLQSDQKNIFHGIFLKDERFDLTICNPPFHSSLAEARAGTLRKLTNLNGKKTTKPILNFGGQKNELWCEGGEERFVGNMILQSNDFATACFWFSTLISKQSHLKSVYHTLKSAEAVEVKTIEMGQGNKSGRLVAWTFLTKEQQKKWTDARWDQSYR